MAIPFFLGLNIASTITSIAARAIAVNQHKAEVARVVAGVQATLGTFRVTVDDRDARRYLGNAERQIKYATAVALTRTAKEIERRLEREMEQVFSNPTRWVTKGTFVKPATKQNLVAVVGLKDRQALYVKEHFYAGQRNQKPYEAALRSMGVLPADFVTVPGAGLKLDSRGNPNRSQLRELIGSVKTGMGVAKGKGKRMKLVGYFAVLPGSTSHLSPGIYWRSLRELKPMLLFVRQADYRRVIDLESLAQRWVGPIFDREFDRAFDEAMRSAR